MNLHVGSEFAVLDLVRLVFTLQRVQKFIVKLFGCDSLHGQMEIRFVSFQAVIQRKLADTQDLQFLVQDAFTPTFPVVLKDTEI